ncbi:MAG: hypothetical protein KDD01_26850 [Phaeodactylibacter sp.]|nr:hypothetical protein [Phaeodactylibacter sp.]
MESKKKFMLEYISSELERINVFVQQPEKWRNGQIDVDFFGYLCEQLDALEEEIQKVCIEGETKGYPSIQTFSKS